jgi:hypothetical protein
MSNHIYQTPDGMVHDMRLGIPHLLSHFCKIPPDYKLVDNPHPFTAEILGDDGVWMPPCPYCKQPLAAASEHFSFVRCEIAYRCWDCGIVMVNKDTGEPRRPRWKCWCGCVDHIYYIKDPTEARHRGCDHLLEPMRMPEEVRENL